MALRDLFTRTSEIEVLQKDLAATQKELAITKKSANDTWEQLDSVIRRENGSEYSYSSITRDYARVGDPYLHNLWVRRAIDTIANNLAALGLEFVNKKTHEPIEDPNNPIIKLFDFINNEDSLEDFIGDIVRWLYRTGTSHILLSDNIDDPFIEQPTVGTPMTLLALKSDRMKPYYVMGQLKYWQYTPGQQALQNKPYYRFYPDQILFLRYKHPDLPWQGLSPVSAAVKEIMQEFYAHVYNIRNFQSGAQGKGVWADPSGKDLTPEQKREAQMAVDNEFNSGVDGAGKTFVLQRKLDWIRTSETNRDLEYVTLLNKMRDDLLAALGVPKVLFATSEATFANLNEAKKIFWSQTVIPLAHKIESGFNTNFFDKFGMNIQMRFKFEGVAELQEDVNVRIDSFKKLVDCGVPYTAAADVTGVPLPEEGWPGWDEPKPTTPAPVVAESEPDIEKMFDLFHIKRLQEEEKLICTDPIHKEMEYKKFLGTALDEEKKIGNTVESYFSEIWKLIEAWLNKNEIKSVTVKSMTKALVNPSYLNELIGYIKSISMSKGWDNILIGRLSDIFTQGALRTAMGIGGKIPKVKLDERALAYYAKRAANLKNVPIGVRDKIIEFLKKESFTTNELAKELSKKFSSTIESTAKNVARTETTAAYNAGRLDGMKELGIKKKMWSSSKDTKVRTSHQIDGEKRMVDEPFSNGLMFPGDQTQGAAEVCNCRCVLLSYIE